MLSKHLQGPSIVELNYETKLITINKLYVYHDRRGMARNCGHLSEHACRSAAIASIPNILLIILLGPSRSSKKIK